MERPEYVKIKLTDIPQEFIDEYNLLEFEHQGWVFFEVIRGGSYFPWEYYTIACNGNPCAILILLLGFYFANYPRVAYFFSTGLGDVTEANEAESVRTCNSLLLGAIRAFSDTLAQSAKFVGVRSLPDVLELGVPT